MTTNTVFITINHLEEYHSAHVLKPGDTVVLSKDPHNQYDDEAIAVFRNEKAKIGYVANSTSTVYKGTYSAGRLYDKFGDVTKGTIRFVMYDSAIAEVTI